METKHTTTPYSTRADPLYTI